MKIFKIALLGLPMVILADAYNLIYYNYDAKLGEAQINIKCNGRMILRCPFRGFVLYITYANWGRTNNSMCSPNTIPPNKTPDLECRAEGFHERMIEMCQLLNMCYIPQPSPQLDPCPETTKYMEVHFVCIKCTWPDPTRCKNLRDQVKKWCRQLKIREDCPHACGICRYNGPY